MNFYKHHIGDYDADTAHLSWDEDMAYTRMIRTYYRREKPLPTDPKEVCRLVRAVTTPQRKAVDAVLREFFTLEADGWHQKRCDDELANAGDAQIERNSKKENERERQRRHRERRKQLFEQLREHDIVPSYETTTEQLQDMLSRVTSDVTKRDKSRDESQPVTRDATANQTPDAISQTPDLKTRVLPDVGGDPPATVRPAELSAAMRRFSIEAQPGDPRIVAAAASGMTVETIEAACAEAKASDPGGRIKPGYVLSIAERWTREANAPRPAGVSRGGSLNARDESRRRAYEVLTGKTGTQPEPETLDGHAKLLG